MTFRVVVLGFIYTIVGIFAAFAPPFNSLGYEFSALFGIIVSLSSGILIIPSIHLIKQGKHSNVRTATIMRKFIELTCVNLLLLGIPFLIMIANAWLVPNCSLLSGILLFFLIPVFTVVFVTALGTLISIILKRWMAYICYYLCVLLVLLHPLLQILTNPQLYAYNHIFGIFIGLSWDESQPPISTLLIYRILTLAYSALLILSTIVLSISGRFYEQKLVFRISVFSCLITTTAIIGAGLGFSDELGITTSNKYVQENLGALHKTKHFMIYYSPFSVTKEEIKIIGEEHEFRLWQVTRALDLKWSHTIRSYLYPDWKTKKRLLGSETTQIARPWMSEIHLSYDGWEKSLKHEIVHVVAGSFGPYLVRTPVIKYYGLTEGLAMAVEWDFGNRTLHQYAAALSAFGMLPSVSSFMSTSGFFNHKSTLSYVASGSFCRWFVESKGLTVLKKAYMEDEIEAATGQTCDDLDTEWRTFLRTVKRDTPDSLAVLYSFHGPPIFRKICSRVLTEINREGAKAAREGDFRTAIKYYQESENLYPNSRAVFGLVTSFFRQQSLDSVLSLTDRFLKDKSRMYVLLPLFLWRGNAVWKTGDSASADQCYSFLVREQPAGWQTEEAEKRLAILRSPINRDIMFRVFDRQTIAFQAEDSLRSLSILDLQQALSLQPDNNLLRLELGKLLSKDRKRKEEAHHIFIGALPGKFYCECLLEIGRYLYDLGKFDDAQNKFLKAYKLSEKQVQRNEVWDYIERCDWKLGESKK